MRPEVQTPVESRSMVRTLRGRGRLADVRREGDRHRVPQARVGDRRDLAGLGVVLGVRPRSRRRCGQRRRRRRRAPCSSGTSARRGPCLLAADHQPAGDQPGDEQSGGDGGVPVVDVAERGDGAGRDVGQQDQAEDPATTTGGAAGGSRWSLMAGMAARRDALGGDDRGGRGATRGDDQPGVAAVDRLAARQHPHGVGEAVDGAAAHHVVVVLERLRDQVDGPRHGKGDEDQRAEVHESEVRSG